VRPEKVFASSMGVRALAEHFRIDQEITAVKDGESLSLGDRQLTFTETRMVHWPDSMFSYLSDDNVLFSQDGFGMHLASAERFADEISDDVLEFEGSRYFANILLPFAPRIEKLLEKVSDLGITPEVIAPDHGPVWRDDLAKILEYYSRWSAQKRGKKAIIVYDTMWGSTDKMARAIAEGVVAGGAEVNLMPLKACHRSDVAGELLDAGALIVGSPTLNNNIYPSVVDVMTYLKGLKPANKIGAVFGSYGWSGEATVHLKKMLEGMGVEMAGDILKVKFVPGDDTLEKCYSLGEEVAARLLKEKD
jgi:flavorubredoxin